MALPVLLCVVVALGSLAIVEWQAMVFHVGLANLRASGHVLVWSTVNGCTRCVPRSSRNQALPNAKGMKHWLHRIAVKLRRGWRQPGSNIRVAA